MGKEEGEWGRSDSQQEVIDAERPMTKSNKLAPNGCCNIMRCITHSVIHCVAHCITG